MKNFRAYFLLFIAVVALCSCDLAKNNKALISEAGKALVEELDQKDGEAGACDASAGAAEADDKLVMQTSPKGTPEQILKRTGYVASYNKTTLLPNWVAWHLTAERTEGSAKRSGVDFAEDTEVPEPRATDWDYYNSGYDRGHMCPAADNKWSKKAMEESFLFTNMCPQNGNLNRGDWNEMEMACRKWAKKYGDLYIVCGPILYKGKHKTIGKNKVVVPEAFFKVVLRTGDDPQAIGFIYKNTSGNRPKDSYVNTVDEVERITGIDFFPSLPDDVEKKVEAECDLGLW
ncbi:DNA/RNA non-specific endonuclease [Prevotella marseillensis]|jgi:endonuclease G|uniref:DNA/RNA non-specific endonuclease n=1 Tax=Prevotella marseillensis TaxID=2479840 RepID=UPI000F63CF88|nr:DNA/RNA non-specific endonuclease [Prevotella marseillensis]